MLGKTLFMHVCVSTYVYEWVYANVYVFVFVYTKYVTKNVFLLYLLDICNYISVGVGSQFRCGQSHNWSPLLRFLHGMETYCGGTNIMLNIHFLFIQISCKQATARCLNILILNISSSTSELRLSGNMEIRHICSVFSTLEFQVLVNLYSLISMGIP